MIDLTLLRENPERIIAALSKKDPHYDIAQLITLDKELRAVKNNVELLRCTKNELAQQGKSGITPELREQSIALSALLKEKEQALETLEREFNEHYLACPNILLDEVPAGNKEENVVVSMFGQKPTYSFTPKNHLDLGEKLGWLDFETSAKIGGASLALYKGEGVALLFSLAMFMLKHNKKHGFNFILPSLFVNEKSLETTGNFPKFRDQVFAVPSDDLFLTPTSEVNLTNMYRDHIFAGVDLPLRMTAFTSCFRREGGAYGSSERGLIRMRQFEKVEIVSMCNPDNSEQEHQRMLACAEGILQALGLHYRVMLLAGQDASWASAKTYDIEIWCPGQNEYKEVSSISNCTDFQARRGMIRFKDKPESKTQLVHTLNGSSLALPRLMVALMETYQQPDGTITIPEILKKEGLF
ncbi:MAG TPA: serine--tRNA ligase [Candidatus Babeliales bacterium]|jgi:seryl-tRNA synthetase|nr:serine--tRNA ligase [Candidatus Babeliales bacterium]